MSTFPWGEFWALASGLLWAVAVILFKRSGETVPPPVLNLFKSLVALAMFLPLLGWWGEGFASWDRETWWLLSLSGFVGITLADTLFFMALNRLGAGMNAIVDCVYFPIMTGMAVVWIGERPTPAALLGGVLILGGILVGSATRPAPGRTRRDLAIGLALGALGMVFIAASVVLIKRLLVPEQLLAVTTWRLFVGMAILVPPVLLRRTWRESLFQLLRPSPLWKPAVPASILGAGMAMLAWIAGFTLTEVSTASMLNQFSTIFIFVLATAVLKEPLTRRRVAALALAFGGAMIVILI